MSTAELTAELRRLGGTPREVLEEQELMDVFLPTVRADFTLLERSRASEREKLTCPLRVLAARDDEEVAFEDASQWGSLAAGEYRFTEMQGGHFYLNSRRDAVIAEVTDAISTWAQSDAAE